MVRFFLAHPVHVAVWSFFQHTVRMSCASHRELCVNQECPTLWMWTYVVRSKNDILIAAVFKYSLHKIRKTILHWQYKVVFKVHAHSCSLVQRVCEKMWWHLTSVLMRLSDQFLSRSHKGDIVSSDGCRDIHRRSASGAYLPTTTHREVWLQQGVVKSSWLCSCHVWAHGCVEIWQWRRCGHYCSFGFVIVQCSWYTASACPYLIIFVLLLTNV